MHQLPRPLLLLVARPRDADLDEPIQNLHRHLLLVDLAVAARPGLELDQLEDPRRERDERGRVGLLVGRGPGLGQGHLVHLVADVDLRRVGGVPDHPDVGVVREVLVERLRRVARGLGLGGVEGSCFLRPGLGVEGIRGAGGERAVEHVPSGRVRGRAVVERARPSGPRAQAGLLEAHCSPQVPLLPLFLLPLAVVRVDVPPPLLRRLHLVQDLCLLLGKARLGARDHLDRRLRRPVLPGRAARPRRIPRACEEPLHESGVHAGADEVGEERRDGGELLRAQTDVLVRD
mmetsp:Transcript_6636/g.16198  ORF Transcript_6636/g.16198 Transcript_6636/m.16198 type:complete len:289 (-) Transcript_6636:1694-2560(-)